MIPKRIVLDTNVCLDLFVFFDPRWTRLVDELRQNKWEAVTQESCRNEWLAVLHYKQLPVTDLNRPDIVTAFDQLIHCISPDTVSTIRLPACTDADDQKFLELARDSKAQFLITKDRALLKCAKRTARDGLFKILTPENFLKNN